MNRFIRELLQSVNRWAVLRTNSRLTGYRDHEAGKIVFYTGTDGKTHSVSTRFLVLACGRSFARELPSFLPTDHVVQQPVDLGIRLVFPRRKDSKFFQVGKDVKLKTDYGDISVRTSCVCSGGALANLRYYGQTYYDGHFGNDISAEDNMGILARSADCVGTESAIAYLAAYQDMVDRVISLKWFLKNWERLPKEEKHRKIFFGVAQMSNSLLASGQLGADADEVRVVMPSADRFNPLVRLFKPLHRKSQRGSMFTQKRRASGARSAAWKKFWKYVKRWSMPDLAWIWHISKPSSWVA